MDENIVKTWREARRLASEAEDNLSMAQWVLDNEIGHVLLHATYLAGAEGIPLSDLKDMAKDIVGPDYDAFPACRHLFRRGLMTFAKVAQPEGWATNVQYITPRGVEIVEGMLVD